MNKTPKRNDIKIDFEQYNQIYKNANLKINFDPTKFNIIEDNSGTYISLNIPEADPFEIRGEEELFKVCALRRWGVPETGSPTLSTSQLIPVSGDPYGYWETTLEPTWDYVRFTNMTYLSGTI